MNVLDTTKGVAFGAGTHADALATRDGLVADFMLDLLMAGRSRNEARRAADERFVIMPDPEFRAVEWEIHTGRWFVWFNLDTAVVGVWVRPDQTQQAVNSHKQPIDGAALLALIPGGTCTAQIERARPHFEQWRSVLWGRSASLRWAG